MSGVIKSDWLFRVGNGENLINSSNHGIWGIQHRLENLLLTMLKLGIVYGL